MTIEFQYADNVVNENGGLEKLRVVYFDTRGDKLDSKILNTKINSARKSIEITFTPDEVDFTEGGDIIFYVINTQEYTNNYIKKVDNFNKNKDKDVVILMDTTKTMRDSYKWVKSEVDNFINNLYKSGNNRVGFMEFNDLDYPAYGWNCNYDRGWLTDYEDFMHRIKFLYCKRYNEGSHNCYPDYKMCDAFQGGGDIYEGWDLDQFEYKQGDYKESSIDALKHVYDNYCEGDVNSNFREEAEKHVVIITDNGFKSGTHGNPSFGINDIIELFAKKNIKVSVIASEKSFSIYGGVKALEQYEPIFKGTGGSGINFHGDDVSKQLENTIINTQSKYMIRLMDGSICELDKDPNLGDTTVDTDNDGKPDLEELIDKKIISVLGFNVDVWTFKSNPTRMTPYGSNEYKSYPIDRIKDKESSGREIVELKELIDVYEEIYSTIYHLKITNDIFVSADDVSQQLMCYIQSGVYGSLQFDILTLPDRNQMKILDINYPMWSKYKNVDLKIDNNIVDLPHMIVALNIIRSGVSGVLDSIGISKHSGGFIGDLQQSIGHALSYSNAKTPDDFTIDIIKSVGVDKFIKPDGNYEESYFSTADLYSDLDAVNIYREYAINNNNVVDAIKTYYSSERYRHRGSEFIKNMGGYESLKKEIMANIPDRKEFNLNKIVFLTTTSYPDYYTINEPKFMGIIKVTSTKEYESIKGASRLVELYNEEIIADKFIEYIRTLI